MDSATDNAFRNAIAYQVVELSRTSVIESLATAAFFRGTDSP